MADAKVVTRFAPSPTGFMHIGGVRTALFAYMWARKNQGTFILRIEDTDQKREVPESTKHIQESLKWLMIDWDYGPDRPGPYGSTVQSERLDTYLVAARKLIDAGHAYADPYSPEELEKFRAQAQAKKRPFLYRDYRPTETPTWDGTMPLRFKVPEVKRYRWHDEVRGDLEAGEEALDDFVLVKSDGYPTYNFAHIVDDDAMQVTHVMRGDEFISSTPRFLSLYDALQIPYPKFVTLPPILRVDKSKKLGKRDGARDILEYRTEGYLPQAMINFLALIGWNPGTQQEIFSPEELVQAFDISQIQTHGGVFNEEKMRWFNKEHLARMDAEAFDAYAAPVLQKAIESRGLAWSASTGKRVILLIRSGIHVAHDIAVASGEGEYDFFFAPPTLDAARIPNKKSMPEDAKKHLMKMAEILTSVQEFTEAAVKEAIWPYSTQMGRGDVLWPLRYALSGRDKSPDPFVISSILGKDETIVRVNTAIQLLAV